MGRGLVLFDVVAMQGWIVEQSKANARSTGYTQYACVAHKMPYGYAVSNIHRDKLCLVEKITI